MRSTERHANGAKSAEGALVDGRREGAWTFWNEHGRRECEEEYSGGERHGWHTSFHTSNQHKRAEGAHAHGQRTGPWEEWHATGQLAARGSYDAGERHGAWSTWHDNGELESQGDGL